MSAANVSVPDVDLAPLHAPLALHAVALVLDQVSIDDALYATEAGFVVKFIVGAGSVTVTVTVLLTDPPAPLHCSVKVLACISKLISSAPCTVFSPDHAPLAMQVVASAAVHVNVAVSPATTMSGAASKTSVGDLLGPLPLSGSVGFSALSTHAIKVTPSTRTSALLIKIAGNRKRENIFVIAHMGFNYDLGSQSVVLSAAIN